MAPSLHLGILEADPVDPDLAAVHGNYPAMFRSLLETAVADLATETAGSRPRESVDTHRGGPRDTPRSRSPQGPDGAGTPSLVTTCWPVWRGVVPPGIDACDGWLVTGSRNSVNDDEPWIRRLEAFVRALHAARRPLLGVCFGHQLVARALGGSVERARVGWGVGTHRYEVCARASWMEPPRETLALRASHQDQVVRLPDGAQLYLRSDFCPLAGFALGTHFVTIQPHPEFPRPYTRALLDRRRSMLGEACWASAVASLDAPVDDRTVGRWLLRFLRGACVDRSSDRLPDRRGSA